MKTQTPAESTELKKLKLGQIIATLAERLMLAEKEASPVDETLLLVLSDEVTRRDSSACKRRAAKAGLEAEMTMERWDPSSKVRYNERMLAELMSLRLVDASKNAVILGAVGDFPGPMTLKIRWSHEGEHRQSPLNDQLVAHSPATKSHGFRALLGRTEPGRPKRRSCDHTCSTGRAKKGGESDDRLE